MLAGLKTRHYSFVEHAEVGMADAAGNAAVNEHKEERSLERLVDMEVSRKKD